MSCGFTDVGKPKRVVIAQFVSVVTDNAVIVPDRRRRRTRERSRGMRLDRGEAGTFFRLHGPSSKTTV